ncbi:hypothetical protein Sliba_00200 [Streptomyces nigrescens]|uniref:Transposase DDE domain-containing protein n=1 Tax=Streptomyces nigrescens TaxID=1920 RepID=A0A640T747_STRNI|nr:hypothetical protein Sliba_00200 [Streptomyces libani subsp. libani]GGW04665.1 hypothetical protein GCM10010500_67220 [Streptomyces libani subsp. libani]
MTVVASGRCHGSWATPAATGLPAKTRDQRRPFPSRRTGPATARNSAPKTVGHHVSTRSTTATAMPSVREQPPQRHRAVTTTYDKLAVRYEATVLAAVPNG